VVLTRDDSSGNKQLVAYLVAAAGGTVDLASVREHVGQELPDYIVPGAWAVLDQLPINSNGKVDRKALPAIAAGPAAAQADHVEPRTPVERAVTGVWRDVLGVPRVGLTDDFFALGGHSLLATQVVARLARIFPDLPTRQLTGALLRRPTVDRFLGAVAEAMLERALTAAASPEQAPLVEPAASVPIPVRAIAAVRRPAADVVPGGARRRQRRVPGPDLPAADRAVARTCAAPRGQRDR
jgi:hypothetical protein